MLATPYHITSTLIMCCSHWTHCFFAANVCHTIYNIRIELEKLEIYSSIHARRNYWPWPTLTAILSFSPDAAGIFLESRHFIFVHSQLNISSSPLVFSSCSLWFSSLSKWLAAAVPRTNLQLNPPSGNTWPMGLVGWLFHVKAVSDKGIWKPHNWK